MNWSVEREELLEKCRQEAEKLDCQFVHGAGHCELGINSGFCTLIWTKMASCSSQKPQAREDLLDICSDVIEEWSQGQANAKTPEEKTKYNVWDNFNKDVLPVLKAAQEGRWSWTKNFDCKYIEVRIDMRSGHCIIENRNGQRINPEDLASQKR